MGVNGVMRGGWRQRASIKVASLVSGVPWVDVCVVGQGVPWVDVCGVGQGAPSDAE